MTIRNIADMQRALGDPTRILIVRMLLDRGLCVCEMVRILEEPQYKVSRHLSVLRQAGLVRDWREGQRMNYEIHPELSGEWMEALKSMSAVWDKDRDIQAAMWRMHQFVGNDTDAKEKCMATN
jgi:ArsR family transcriptional regulator, arsenate/arsenite/antimonite-responsive transcriptional repressor